VEPGKKTEPEEQTQPLEQPAARGRSGEMLAQALAQIDADQRERHAPGVAWQRGIKIQFASGHAVVW
jgi:hypothetical protein